MPWRPRWTFWVTLFIEKFGWSYNVFLQKQRGRFAFFKLFIFFAILFSTWKIGGGGSNPKRLVFLHKRPQPLARGPEGQGPAAEAEGRHCQDRCNRLGPKRGACWREAPSGSQTGELSLLGRHRGCSDRVNSSILSTSPRGTSPTPAPLSSFLHRRVHSIAAWYIYLFIVGKRECLFLQLLPGSSQETNGFHTFQPVSVAGSSHSGPGFPLQSADHSRRQG